MIKPATLWSLMKTCPDSKWIGDVCRALGGQEVQLDFGQQQCFQAIRMDSDWMDERVDERKARDRERKAAYRKSKTDCPTDSECPTDSTLSHGIRGTRGTDKCPTASAVSHTIHPSIHPSVRPSIRPEDNNHSITIPITREDAGNGNGNGNGMDSNEIVRDINSFVAEVQADPENGGNAFFDAKFDPVVIACAVVGDTNSQRRWRQAANELGEDAMRQELFQFYREIRAGESVDNKGAALNARLKKIGSNK